MSERCSHTSATSANSESFTNPARCALIEICVFPGVFWGSLRIPNLAAATRLADDALYELFKRLLKRFKDATVVPSWSWMTGVSGRWRVNS